MNNFELIDEYLTNRLSEQDKIAFEQKLNSDPALKADFDFQTSIVEGVKRARVTELKAMLNNVPVGGAVSSALTAGKLAAGIVTAGIVATGVYLYFSPKTEEGLKPATITTKDKTESPVKELKPTKITPVEAPKAKEEALTEKPKVKIPVKKDPIVVRQPKIEVEDPSSELVDNASKNLSSAESQKSSISTSHISVDAISNNKKYNFHYQFSAGKLVLYGPFDKSLYEILEIHGDRHLVFLFYKDNYYSLDEKRSRISDLTPIKDAALVKKLREYRARQ